MKKLLLYLFLVNSIALQAQNMDYAAFEKEANIAMINDFEKLSLLTKEQPELSKTFANKFFSLSIGKFMKDLDSLNKSKKDLEYSRFIKKTIKYGTVITTLIAAYFYYRTNNTYKNAKTLYDTQVQAVKNSTGVATASLNVLDAIPQQTAPQALISNLLQTSIQDMANLNQNKNIELIHLNDFLNAKSNLSWAKIWFWEQAVVSIFFWSFPKFKTEKFNNESIDAFSKQIENKKKILELLTSLKSN